MTIVGRPDRATQKRLVALFREELGYRYLGDWSDRAGNSNIEEEPLSAWLTKDGYTAAQIGVGLYKLRTEADNHNRTLYGNNEAIYGLLRYGIPVKIEAGKVTETVHLINWHEPEQNDFALAEEVTLKGNHERRPDIVLYVNGIAVGVLELKTARLRWQRFGRAAIRHHRHAREIFPQMEGGRGGQQALQARQVPAQDV